MKRAVLCATVLAVTVAVVVGQRGDVGKSPREVLNPKTVKDLQTPIVQRIETDQQATERQLGRLSGQMQTVVEQLQSVVKFENQIITNTQAITDIQRRVGALEDRVGTDEKGQSSDPANIAVLNNKVDGLVKVGTWILVSSLSILASSIAFVAKRLYNGGVVTMKWAKADAEKKSEDLSNYRASLFNKLDEVRDKAEAAYAESNSVNTKIAQIGLQMKDGEPLSEKEHEANET